MRRATAMPTSCIEVHRNNLTHECKQNANFKCAMYENASPFHVNALPAAAIKFCYVNNRHRHGLTQSFGNQCLAKPASLACNTCLIGAQ